MAVGARVDLGRLYLLLLAAKGYLKGLQLLFENGKRADFGLQSRADDGAWAFLLARYEAKIILSLNQRDIMSSLCLGDMDLVLKIRYQKEILTYRFPVRPQEVKSQTGVLVTGHNQSCDLSSVDHLF